MTKQSQGRRQRRLMLRSTTGATPLAGPRLVRVMPPEPALGLIPKGANPADYIYTPFFQRTGEELAAVMMRNMQRLYALNLEFAERIAQTNSPESYRENMIEWLAARELQLLDMAYEVGFDMSAALVSIEAMDAFYTLQMHKTPELFTPPKGKGERGAPAPAPGLTRRTMACVALADVYLAQKQVESVPQARHLVARKVSATGLAAVQGLLGPDATEVTARNVAAWAEWANAKPRKGETKETTEARDAARRWRKQFKENALRLELAGGPGVDQLLMVATSGLYKRIERTSAPTGA